jgi:hypothetical protein
MPAPTRPQDRALVLAASPRWRRLVALAAPLLAAVLAAAPAGGQTSIAIHSGFDDAVSQVIANGALDDDFAVVGPAGSGIDGPAVVVNDDAFPIPPWLPSSPSSKWIGASAGSSAPAGEYRYSIAVELPPGSDGPIAVLSGSAAADDRIADLLVNGVSTGFSADGFGALASFPPDLGLHLFRAGANIIEFVVVNGGEGPSGLRVEAQVSACPAPPIEPPPAANGFFLDTGFDDALGALAANLARDDNYQVYGLGVAGVCRQQALVLDDRAFPIAPNGPWVGTTPQSKWIGVSADSNAAPGFYVFAIAIEIPAAVDASQLRLIGGWSSDNRGADVLINGAPASIAQDGDFTVFHAFPPDAGLGHFRSGRNLVEFIVENALPGTNPAGLRVEAVAGAGDDPRDLSSGHGPRGIGPLPGGFADGRYSVEVLGDSGPRAAGILESLPELWLPNEHDSKWIGAAGGAVAAGAHVYRIRFRPEPEDNPSRLAIAGGWAAPRGIEIRLNGATLAAETAGPGALALFPERFGLGAIAAGENTLEFVVSGDAGVPPAALRVDARIAPLVETHPLDISSGFIEDAAEGIPPGGPDDDYEVAAPGAAAARATVISGAPVPPWLQSTDSSSWIGAGAAGGVAIPGRYSFRTRVVLAGVQAPRAFIRGYWAADDAGADVLINGRSTGARTASGFTAFTPFPESLGLGFFAEGENLIEFVVENGGAEPNPSGLRVDAVVVAPLEPEGGLQLPGDCNQDGALDISDARCLLGYLYSGRPSVLPCGDGGSGDAGSLALLDSNGDGLLDLSDAVRVLGFLFLGNPPPVLGDDCVHVAGCPDRCVP